MAFGNQAIESLRAALELSPDNTVLRLHLAATLLDLGRFTESESEFRIALSKEPNNQEIKVCLADCYFRQEKNSQALVIVEDLAHKQDTDARVYLLYTRLLLKEGDISNAVAQYKLALETDPEVEDTELTQRLGMSPQDGDFGVHEGRLREPTEVSPAEFHSDVERPEISFADVGGMSELKEEIGMKIIYPLKHPELYEAYGKQIGGGILLYGPPGCGKTYLSRATAGEISAGFLTIGINDVLDMWIGQSEQNLHALFETARHNTPCVIFFDEVDALGGRRSDMAGGSARQLINQFLSEMDGVASANDGVLVLAATNAPWHVDPAFRRPGRFDRVLFVPPPDSAARADILRLLLEGKPAEAIDFEHLAGKLDHFSGADLKAVVDTAIESKLREAMRLGVPQPLTTKDLMAAGKTLKPTTREWFSTAKNYALYSNQGGVYDDVLKYMKL